MNQSTMKKISFSDAQYLKHIGKLNNTKVTLEILESGPVVYIQDFEFYTFQQALRFLQEDARRVLHSDVIEA